MSPTTRLVSRSASPAPKAFREGTHRLLAPEKTLARARRFMPVIAVSLRANDFSLAATELRFSDGSALHNDFTNAILNPPLPEGIFDLKLEPGFTVVEPLRP